MKGQILDYSIQTNSGLISGDDGARYTFTGVEWRGRENTFPTIGSRVDFDTQDNTALAIYPEAMSTVATPDSTPTYPKSRIVAGVLALVVGGLGIHKFYLNYIGQGVALLVITLFIAIVSFSITGSPILNFLIVIFCLVEGVIYLTKSEEEFQQIYVEGTKPWL